ncbi:MAG: cupin domain-containing protein [Armatimonadetes bacterium]|nr:cupin domain-containing protein [Armatimonadota bacterium]
MTTAEDWIAHLQLTAHPEGGYFRETYRSAETVSPTSSRYTGQRAASTAIYFLLRGNQISRLHRLCADEVWHFYAGSSLTLHLLFASGKYEAIRLGDAIGNGEQLQAVIPAGCWFGANLNRPDSFTLVGCTVAPGFDFQDFEMGTRSELIKKFPQHQEIVEQLTDAGGT